MGKNAQIRRDRKRADKLAQPFQGTRRTDDTKTLQRLRQQMREVQTLQQFEEILAGAHEDHRGRVRKLLEPMLRPHLPCCGVHELARKLGDEDWREKHGRLCPSRNRVRLVHA